MVGDRLYTDVRMAERTGEISVLVLTGEATAQEVASLSPPPDVALSNLGELAPLLAAAR